MQKVQLIGHVGKEPEIKVFDNGGMKASFSLATTERGYTTKSGATIPEHTEWWNISVGGKLAEVVQKWVHKGDKLFVEGKQFTRQYEDKQGQTKYFVEIQVKELEMLGSKKDKEDGFKEPPQGQKVTSEARGFTDEEDEKLPF